MAMDSCRGLAALLGRFRTMLGPGAGTGEPRAPAAIAPFAASAFGGSRPSGGEDEGDSPTVGTHRGGDQAGPHASGCAGSSNPPLVEWAHGDAALGLLNLVR